METTFSKSQSRSPVLVAGLAILLLALALVAVIVLTAMLRDELKRDENMQNDAETIPPSPTHGETVTAMLRDELKRDENMQNDAETIPPSPTHGETVTDICQGNTIDLAVVGVGASGSFAAWQLNKKHQAHWEIKLFDANDRVGGRLYSIPIPGIENHVADVGAMRFKTSHNSLIRVINQLGLTVDNFTTPKKQDTLYYLRDKILTRNDIETGKVPYYMTDYERSISADTGTLLAYWNNMVIANSSKGLLDPYQQMCVDGKMAYEKGNANAYGEFGSSEAIEYIAYRDAFPGEYFNNPNYASYSTETTYTPEDPNTTPEQVYTIREGFQEIVKRMTQEVVSNNWASLHLNHTLTAVNYRSDGPAHLTFYDQSRQQFVHYCARKVILALPAEALKHIHFDRDVGSVLEPLVNAVQVAPAGKSYLAYDRAWWRDEGQGQAFDELRQNGVDLKFMITDTPLGTILDIGSDAITGKALLLCYFDWWKFIRFWTPYYESGTPHSSSIDADAAVTESSIIEIHRQLSKIFNISADEIPMPYASVTHMWYKGPYWTGWHEVKGGYNYPEIRERIRKPIDNKELYLIGEAFSDNHAWTEGALETAENVLSQYFDITEF